MPIYSSNFAAELYTISQTNMYSNRLSIYSTIITTNYSAHIETIMSAFCSPKFRSQLLSKQRAIDISIT